jgi:hypothetical protein
MKLHSSVIDIAHLTCSDRDTMFALMVSSYANMRRDRFDADLDAKQWAIVIRSPQTDRIVGFSTQVLLTDRVHHQIVHTLYSGDTVVDREHWGDPALASAWGNFALALIERHPDTPLYWFLTSKGFRTYRYLPLFFRTYFPRRRSQTPYWERATIDRLGTRIGGASYDAMRQLIVARPGKDFARRECVEPGRRVRTDPHVKFFIERNPNYHRGDELCCLAPLTRENFTRVAYRVISAKSSALTAV